VTARQLFFTPDGSLRSPWRIGTFLLCWIFAAAVTWGLLGQPLAWIAGHLGLGPIRVNDLVGAISLLGAHALTLRFDKRPWRYVGLGPEEARPTTWLHGFAIGALAISVPIALLIGTGWLDRIPAAGHDVAAASVRVTLVLLPAALTEELLMRGYIFSVLRGVWGSHATLLVTSILFALLHIKNAGATVTSLAFVALAGVFLGSVLVKTGSLYAAWMAHFAWNWAMAVVFHTSVSGWALEAPGYRYVDAGPDWATGGAWGPEIGVPACLMMIAGTGLLLRMSSRAKARDVHLENR
jgi:membrane protease YdiL (CAAX protease family)